MKRTACIVSLVLGAAACGGPAEPAKGPDDGEPTSADRAPTEDADAAAADTGEPPPQEESAGGLPSRCAKQDGDICLPPEKFVLALCNHDYPTVALNLFAAGTPWTRGYTLSESKAVNASGGGSTGDTVKVDEEVLVLRKRVGNQPGGIQVSGADGSIDVLRWDGSCVTLHPSEVSFDPPAKIKNARIIWNHLEAELRDALKANETVFEAYKVHKAECKGVSFGKVSKKCVDADATLSAAIAQYVRDSGKLPPPNKLPEL